MRSRVIGVTAALAVALLATMASAEAPQLTLSLEGAKAVYIQDASGAWSSYVVDAPEFVNRAFIDRWASDTPLPSAGTLGSDDTLGLIQDRGKLRCGVHRQRPLFSFTDAEGAFAGFDIEFCKAIAAAVLGDHNKVEYYDASHPFTRFELLTDGWGDVLIRTTTITASRDRELQVDFAQATFYAGQGFAVRRDSGYETITDLEDATICVTTGTTAERTLAEHFTDLGLIYNPIGGWQRDVEEAFFSGRCPVLTHDVIYLASLLAARDDGANYTILPQLISKEPVAPVVREDDSEWRDIVNWVVSGLIAAEELGITRANVASMAADPPHPTIARLLGVPWRHYEVGSLGFARVDAQFIQRAIAVVGNYGEIYARTIGDVIPRACTFNALASEDKRGCPPGSGGILYALPYR